MLPVRHYASGARAALCGARMPVSIHIRIRHDLTYRYHHGTVEGDAATDVSSAR